MLWKRVRSEVEELLAEADKAIRSIRSLTADVHLINHYQNGERVWECLGHVRLMRPNFAYLEVYSNFHGGQGEFIPVGKHTVASDGTMFWHVITGYDGDRSVLDEKAVPKSGRGIDLATYCLPLVGFFDRRYTEWVVKSVKCPTILKYTGTEVWEGEECRIVEWECLDGLHKERQVIRYKVYIDPHGLLRRFYYTTYEYTSDRLIQNVQINPPMDRSDFHFPPPRGTTERESYPWSLPPSQGWPGSG